MNEEQREKKADNVIIDSNLNKRKLDLVDDRIQMTKDTLKEVDNLYGTYQSMNKNINKCIDLLNQAVRGGQAQNILDDARIEMKEVYVGAISRLDERALKMKKDLKNLYNYKEKILTEERKELQKENEKNKEK